MIPGLSIDCDRIAYDEIEDERIWGLVEKDTPRLMEQLRGLMRPRNI
jgi:hypothetical protein